MTKEPKQQRATPTSGNSYNYLQGTPQTAEHSRTNTAAPASATVTLGQSSRIPQKALATRPSPGPCRGGTWEDGAGTARSQPTPRIHAPAPTQTPYKVLVPQYAPAGSSTAARLLPCSKPRSGPTSLPAILPEAELRSRQSNSSRPGPRRRPAPPAPAPRHPDLAGQFRVLQFVSRQRGAPIVIFFFVYK